MVQSPYKSGCQNGPMQKGMGKTETYQARNSCLIKRQGATHVHEVRCHPHCDGQNMGHHFLLFQVHGVVAIYVALTSELSHSPLAGRERLKPALQEGTNQPLSQKAPFALLDKCVQYIRYLRLELLHCVIVPFGLGHWDKLVNASALPSRFQP